MPTRLYQDYINVDPNFIPVFSSNSDRVYPDKWQSFYPHASFKTVLTSVVEMLEKGSASKDMSQWMSGSYGTGKTYASFTIKHILEDPLDRVEPYFVQNKMTALWTRLKGIRSKGNILVVHKSASSGLDTQNKLFNAMTSAVREALIEKGYTYYGAASRYDKVLETLKNPDSAFNFKGAFNKYRARFTEYASPEDVVEDLEKLPEDDRMDLLDIVIQVAEEENYNWSSTPEEVIDWMEDVRIGNNLYAIVMIWDEFTEYFKKNQNNITGLQEIAHASSRISFYLFLITHSDVNQLIADQNARKIMQARFVSNQLRLGENTALTLLGQALRHEPDLQREWNNVADNLWASVKRGCVDHIKSKDASLLDTDIKNLFPMQPYASYLLKFIAQEISSNQRTMFQFLSGDYKDANGDRTNFRWFIDNYGFEYGKWNLLTADYLWDYFFYADNVDLGSSFMDAISHYANFESVCGQGENGDNCRRVLKVALLLYALYTKNGSSSRSGPSSLLRPTGKNIKACFVGTPIENRVQEYLDLLDSKGVLGSMDDLNVTLYVITSVAVDQDKMANMEANARKVFSFDKLIQDSSGYDVVKPFKPTDFLKERCKILTVTPGSARSEAIKHKDVAAANHLSVFYLFAQNEAEQGKTADAIKNIYTELPERCIVVDFTGLPFTDERYERFIKSKAKEKYFDGNPRHKDQMNLAKQSCANIVNEWTINLITASIRVYTSPEKSEVTSGGANLRRKLLELNAQFYGCGLEEISMNDKLFASSGYKEVVCKIAMGKEPVSSNYAYLRNISSELTKAGIWSDPGYWINQPNHTVSKMKQTVEEVIQQSFEKQSMVKVTDIWHALMKPPFGLMPCTGSAFLVAFLLKEYGDTTYYLQDQNNNSTVLSSADLSSLIYAVVKGLPKAGQQYIVRQKKEHISFCQITGEIFMISKDKRNSISDIKKNLNIYLTQHVYPLWSLVCYVDEDMDDDPMQGELVQLIELLCEFVNPETMIDRDPTMIAEQINALYERNPGIEAKLGQIITDDCLRAGMEYYIANQKSELCILAQKLRLDSHEYLSLLTKKFSSDASYLWKKGDIDNQIDSLYTDLRLIDAINGVLSTPQKTYKNAREELLKKLNMIVLPETTVLEYHPELKLIMEQFYLIRNNAVTDRRATAQAISGLTAEFLDFFNNQFITFSDAIRVKVDSGVNESELDHLYNQVSSGVLFQKVDEFVLNMKRALNKYRKEQKIQKLFDVWKKETGTRSPAEWSKVHGIPVLCMFQKDLDKAQLVFGTLNNTMRLPEEDAIEQAVAFVTSDKLDVLKDQSVCNDAFIQYFCDENSFIVENPDILRDVLKKNAGNNVYDWFTKKALCKKAIGEMIDEQYKTKYRGKASSKVDSMSANEAKNRLKTLADENPRIGLWILRNK